MSGDSNQFGWQALRDILQSDLSRGAKNAIIRLRIYCHGSELSFEREYADGLRLEDVLRMLDVSKDTWDAARVELIAVGAIVGRKLRNGRVLYDLVPPTEWLCLSGKNPKREKPTQGSLSGKKPKWEKPTQLSGKNPLSNGGKTHLAYILKEVQRSTEEEAPSAALNGQPHGAPPSPEVPSTEGEVGKGFTPSEEATPPPTPSPASVASATATERLTKSLTRSGQAVPLPDLSPATGAYVDKEATTYNSRTGQITLVNGAGAEFEKELRRDFGANIDLADLLRRAGDWVKPGVPDVERKKAIRRTAEKLYPQRRPGSPRFGAVSTTDWRVKR